MKYLLITLVFISSISFAGFNDTPKYYKCYNKIGGSWSYGRAPNVCDLDTFISKDYVESEFEDLIFVEKNGLDFERKRYMTELYGMLKDLGVWYLNSRKPNAPQAEKDAWVQAVFAIANQESYWSHYRISTQNSRLQMMRGDFGHGHGLMQVDDRWHFNAILDGSAANIVMNSIYSLDEYYAAWKGATSKWCIEDPTDYYSISRAAYSAYNGGPSKICRWTNPNDKWARNDKGFKQKLDAKSWNKYITDFNIASSIDISCVANGLEGCSASGGSPVEELVSGKVYKIPSGELCVFHNEKLECTVGTTAKNCLVARYRDDFNSNPKIYSIASELAQSVEKKTWHEQSACMNQVDNLYRVGDNVKVNKNINVRKTPGGLLLGTASKNNIYQVLNVSVGEYPNFGRYYLVKEGSSYGYVYAGKESDSNSWVSKSSIDAKEKLIASAGDNIVVTKPEGIKYFSFGELGFRNGILEKGTTLKVESWFLSVSSSFYYKVKIDGDDGYIFAGTLGDNFKLSSDISIEGHEVIEKVQGHFISSIYYMNVRSKKSTSSKINGVIAGPKESDKNFEVMFSDGEWTYIKQGTVEGYVKTKFVVTNA